MDICIADIPQSDRVACARICGSQATRDSTSPGSAKRARRSDVLRSLAERGRPVMWANEKEAAALSGVGDDAFRRKIKQWEADGFPKINSENGKRSIPAILAFWARSQNHSPVDVGQSVRCIDDEDGEENWRAIE